MMRTQSCGVRTALLPPDWNAKRQPNAPLVGVFRMAARAAWRNAAARRADGARDPELARDMEGVRDINRSRCTPTQ